MQSQILQVDVEKIHVLLIELLYINNDLVKWK